MTGRRKGKRVETGGAVQVHGKNANGEGSVYFDRSADRHVATWWVPGEKRPRKATGKTRDQAITRRKERMAIEAPSAAELETVSQLADWWLHNVQKPKVRPSSWRANLNQVLRIKATLGSVKVTDLEYAKVVAWLASIIDSGEISPKTARETRQALAQIIDQAVIMGTIKGNPVRAVDPPSIVIPDKDALTSAQIQQLLGMKEVSDHRLAAAVALLFVQGWRISEVMGLATDDVDLETGRAVVRRASVYVAEQGQLLQPYAKEDGSMGEYWLQPIVVELLGERLDLLQKEKADAATWEVQFCEKKPVNLIFPKLDGRLLRIHDVAYVVAKAVDKLGWKVSLGTHGGRRSVVTVLYSEGDEHIDDIARYVGHSAPESTARYVKRLGKRPKDVAERAGKLLGGSNSDSDSKPSASDEDPGAAA